MKKFALAAAILLAAPVPVSASTMVVAVFDNGTLVGSTNSVTGLASLFVSSDPFFDTLAVAAAGSPFLPHGDLSSVTLDVSSAAITSVHNLTVDIIQFGLSANGGTKSTFSVDNVAGPGPATTLSTFVNGTSIASLGTGLDSHTFALGTSVGSFGPIFAPAGAIVSDAEQFQIAFTMGNQSANDTIGLSSNVPEAPTWGLFALGLLSMAFVGRWRKHKEPFAAA